MKMRQRRKIKHRQFMYPAYKHARWARGIRTYMLGMANVLGVTWSNLAEKYKATRFSAAKVMLEAHNERWNGLRERASETEFSRVMLGIPYTVIRPDLPIDPPKD